MHLPQYYISNKSKKLIKEVKLLNTFLYLVGVLWTTEAPVGNRFRVNKVSGGKNCFQQFSQQKYEYSD